MLDLNAFDVFADGRVIVTRQTEDARGLNADEPTTKQILSCSCDAQDGGRRLERRAVQAEEGDLILYCSTDVSDVRTDDTAAVTTHDGRSLIGQVIQVSVLDDSLLIALT
jgi:hypothetical protein